MQCAVLLLYDRAFYIMFYFLFLSQLAELEQRVVEAETRADEAEDKVRNSMLFYLITTIILILRNLSARILHTSGIAAYGGILLT